MADRDSYRRRSTRPATLGRVASATGSAEDRGPTIASYFGAFAPAPSWTDLSRWPPDVFALSNLVLDHTEAYRFAVAPPGHGGWPPSPDWSREVVAAARDWREAAASPGRDAPPTVRRLWDVVVGDRDAPLTVLRRGEKRSVWEALLTLHAMADEACASLASAAAPSADGAFERRAWELFAEHGSLSRMSAARVRVTPKTNFAARGISIRSLSRYLALNYESVELRWRRIEAEAGSRRGFLDRREYSMVLVPWPLRIEAGVFHPIEGPLENMDRKAFGFFEFAPEPNLDLDLLARLIDEAHHRTRSIDALVLPEAAVHADEIRRLEELLADRQVTLLVAGVRCPADARGLGHNFVHVGVRADAGWQCFEQAKHHRWSLDDRQIRQYHLSRSLAPSKQWWEAIDLPSRSVQIVDMGGGTTIVPLVCEDLARLDEVADMLRRVGPSLVLALLLDGPQLPGRWSHRYASVLADEPGSTVLTLTSYGMVARSRPPGMRASRAVALWSDPASGTHHLELARGSAGILINATVRAKTVWTADGRRHERRTPSIELMGVHQLRTRGT